MASSLAEEELARLKQAMNIAEDASRWLRSSLRRLRDGTDIEFEIHNMEQALRAARAAVKQPPDSRTAVNKYRPQEMTREGGAVVERRRIAEPASAVAPAQTSCSWIA